MLQHHVISLVLCLISTRCLLIIEGWSGNTYRIHAFKAHQISYVHQPYFKRTKRSNHCCTYVSNGINESLFNVSSIDKDSKSDEANVWSIDTINTDNANVTSENKSQPSSNNTIRGITLKLAFDLNGGVACRSEIRPERFTCTESLDMVHRLRSKSDAVLIGVGTAIVDNPSLLVRRNITVLQQPLRVVIDPMLRFITPSASSSSQHDDSYQLLTDGYPVVIFHCRNDTTTNKVIRDIVQDLPSSVQLHYVESIDGRNLSNAPRINVQRIVDHLQKEYNVQHLMVEGGPSTARLFLQSNLIDRFVLVQAPIRFDDPILANITPSALQSANLIKLGAIQSGQDIIECWSRPEWPWPESDLHDWP